MPSSGTAWCRETAANYHTTAMARWLHDKKEGRPTEGCGDAGTVWIDICTDGGRGWASSAQHHQGDGPTSLLGSVSMGKEQRAVCSDGLVVEVEAAVWLKFGYRSPLTDPGRCFIII